MNKWITFGEASSLHACLYGARPKLICAILKSITQFETYLFRRLRKYQWLIDLLSQRTARLNDLAN